MNNAHLHSGSCVAVISTSGVEMRAQMSGSPPPVGTKEDPAKAVDGLISMMESEVVGAAKAMPAEKYNFAPSQGIFAASQTTQFDTVRTFVAQVTHLAQANYFFSAILPRVAAEIRLDGKMRIANAGHLPPYLNGKEIELRDRCRWG